MANHLPFVSILVPARNEAKFLADSLDSILSFDYDPDQMEILVLDGMSDDGSVEIAARSPRVRILQNPNKIVSSGLNIGIREARGEIIIRMDAHTTYAPDYVHRCVELLQTTDASCVGGPQRPVGKDFLGEAIAAATSGAFGTGGARFRVSSSQEWVDTVYLGAWRKKTLLETGGFNEKMVVNQDSELNNRIRKRGGKILLDPGIRSEYRVRKSLGALGLQYFRYGFWRVKNLRLHPGSVKGRQLAPPVLVLALLLSPVAIPFFWPATVLVPVLYAATTLVASVLTAARKGWRILPALPIVFMVLHLAWGAGFWAGIARFGIPLFLKKNE